ncbi:hypothetical protein ACF0H5_002125 [Mactra antiquata]
MKMTLNMYVPLVCVFVVSYVNGIENATKLTRNRGHKYEILTKLFEEFQDILETENKVANIEPTTVTNVKEVYNHSNGIDDEQNDLEFGNRSKLRGITETDRSDVLNGINDLKQSMKLLYMGISAEKGVRKKDTESLVDLKVTVAETLEEIANETDEINERVQEVSSKVDSIATIRTELMSTRTNIDQCNLNVKSVDDKVEKIVGITDDVKLSNDKIEQCNENVKSLSRKVDVIYLGVRMIMSMMNTNIARGKSATESSTYTDQFTKLGPNAATDGNTNGTWSGGSCTHTHLQKNPWWKVDLDGQFFIKKIVIKNRQDCCGERLNNLVVTVSQTNDGDEVKCGEFKGPGKTCSTETIHCEPDVIGRFVKIQINGKGVLTLCEVEIYA